MSVAFGTIAALLRRKELPPVALLPTICSVLSPALVSVDFFQPLMKETDGTRLFCRLLAVLGHGTRGGPGLSAYAEQCHLMIQLLVAAVTDEDLSHYFLSEVTRVKLLAKLAPEAARKLLQVVLRAGDFTCEEEDKALAILLHGLVEQRTDRIDEGAILLLWEHCFRQGATGSIAVAQQLYEASIHELLKLHRDPGGLGFFFPVDSAGFQRLRSLLLCLCVASRGARLVSLGFGPGILLEVLSALLQKHFPLAAGGEGARPATARARPGSSTRRLAVNSHDDPCAPLEFLAESVCHRLQSAMQLALVALSQFPALNCDRHCAAGGDAVTQATEVVNNKLWAELEASVDLAQSRSRIHQGVTDDEACGVTSVLAQEQRKRYEADERFVRHIQLDSLSAAMRWMGSVILKELFAPPLMGGTALRIVCDAAPEQQLVIAQQTTNLGRSVLSIIDAAVPTDPMQQLRLHPSSMVPAMGAVVELAHRTVTLLLSSFYSQESGSRSSIAESFDRGAVFPLLGDLDCVARVVLRVSSHLLMVRSDWKTTDKSSVQLLQQLIRSVHCVFGLIVICGDSFAASSGQVMNGCLPPIKPQIMFEKLPDDFLKECLAGLVLVLNMCISTGASEPPQLVSEALEAVTVAMQCVDMDTEEIATRTMSSLFDVAVWASEQVQPDAASHFGSLSVDFDVLRLYTSPRARRAPQLFARISETLRSVFTQQQLNIALFVDSSFLRNMLCSIDRQPAAVGEKRIDQSLRAASIAAILSAAEEPLITDGDLAHLIEEVVSMLARHELCGIAALRDISTAQRKKKACGLFSSTMWVDRIFPVLIEMVTCDINVFAVVCEQIVPGMPFEYLAPSAVFKLLSQLIQTGALTVATASPTVTMTSEALQVIAGLTADQATGQRRLCWSCADGRRMLLEFIQLVVVPRVLPLVLNAGMGSNQSELTVGNIAHFFEILAPLDRDRTVNCLAQRLCAPLQHGESAQLLTYVLLQVVRSGCTRLPEQLQLIVECSAHSLRNGIPSGNASPHAHTRASLFARLAERRHHIKDDVDLNGDDFVDQCTAAILASSSDNSARSCSISWQELCQAALLRILDDKDCFEVASIVIHEIEDAIKKATEENDDETNSPRRDTRAAEDIFYTVLPVAGTRKTTSLESVTLERAERCRDFVSSWIGGILLEARCEGLVAQNNSFSSGGVGKAAETFAADLMRDDASSMVPEVVAGRQSILLGIVTKACSLSSYPLRLQRDDAPVIDGIVDCRESMRKGASCNRVNYVIGAWQDALARGLRPRRDLGLIGHFSAYLDVSGKALELKLLRSLLALRPEFLAPAKP